MYHVLPPRVDDEKIPLNYKMKGIIIKELRLFSFDSNYKGRRILLVNTWILQDLILFLVEFCRYFEICIFFDFPSHVSMINNQDNSSSFFYIREQLSNGFFSRTGLGNNFLITFW